MERHTDNIWCWRGSVAILSFVHCKHETDTHRVSGKSPGSVLWSWVYVHHVTHGIHNTKPGLGCPDRNADACLPNFCTKIFKSLLIPYISVTVEAWHAAVHGVAKSQTRLSHWTTATTIGKIIIYLPSMMSNESIRATKYTQYNLIAITFLPVCSVASSSFVTPLDGIAHHPPLSMGFSRQEHCRGLPFPSPEDLPNLGIDLCLQNWQVDSLCYWDTC